MSTLNRVELNKNEAVYLNFEHKNYKNPVLVVTAVKNEKIMDSVYINKGVFGKAEKTALTKIKDTLNNEFCFDFTDEVVKQIYDMACVLMKDYGKNMAEKMCFNDVISEIFTLYKNDNTQMLVSGAFMTHCYTVVKPETTDIYFCIPSTSLQHILNQIESGWKVLEFKRSVVRYCECWTGNGSSHHGEYQNMARNEPWSLRIKMTDKFFSAEEIEFAKKYVKQ